MCCSEQNLVGELHTLEATATGSPNHLGVFSKLLRKSLRNVYIVISCKDRFSVLNDEGNNENVQSQER